MGCGREKIVKTEKSTFQKETFGSLKLTGSFLGQDVNPGLLEGREQRRGGFSNT